MYAASGGPNMRKMFCMVGQPTRRLRIKVEQSSDFTVA